MKRPSRRSVLIGSGFFVLGFIVAIALTTGFVLWLIRQNWGATQANIVGNLALSNSLLTAADQSSDKLTTTVIWTAQENSELAAEMFNTLTKPHQAMVLRQFARLNQSTTLRTDQSPRGRAALLARSMVLCSRDSANPGVVHVGKDVTMFTGIPGWVLDPDATPVAPTPVRNAEFEQTPEVLSAELKKWTALHEWVKANRACVAGHEIHS